jgi:hypothetical protein
MQVFKIECNFCSVRAKLSEAEPPIYFSSVSSFSSIDCFAIIFAILETMEVDAEELIMKPESQFDNLCMVDAFYNSLRTHKLRIAFAQGRKDYAEGFVEFHAARGKAPVKKMNDAAIKKLSKAEKADRMKRNKEGYTPRDILDYLKWLKEKNFIKGFIFKSWPTFSMVHMLNRNNIQDLKKVLLCGYAVTTKTKESLNFKKRFKPEWLSECEDRTRQVRVTTLDGHNQKTIEVTEPFINNTQLRELCNIFEVWNVKITSSSTHGVVLARESDGEIYLYDNGCKKRHRVTQDVLQIASRIGGIWKDGAFIFDMSTTEDIHDTWIKNNPIKQEMNKKRKRNHKEKRFKRAKSA